MAHHKRKRPKNRRAGCLMCKPWKVNGFAKSRAGAEQFGDHRRRLFAERAVRSVRETLRVAGLEFFPLGADTVGGRANVPNQLVFIGSSSNGEGYRHELAHVVLAPFLAPFKAAGLVQEGLMTWTGGSAGLAFEELIPALKHYLDAHPDLTLESIMTNPPLREGTLDVGYDGLAVLCEMVHRAGGLAAIRALANAGAEPRLVLSTAAQLLNVSPAEVDALWRNRIAVFSR